MNAFIKKVKSFGSLKSKSSLEPITQSSSKSPATYYAPRISMQKLQAPKVLYMRRHNWRDVGKKIRMRAIQNGEEQKLVVNILESLVDVMLDEAFMEDVEVY
jgi:hypothetical protein